MRKWLPTNVTEWTTIVLALVAGTAVWWWAMASAPRYSYGPDQDTGSLGPFILLLVFAVIGGIVCYRAPFAIPLALALGLPGLLLSPSTTPRGDNDGLWTLIVPMMAVFICLLAALSAASAAWRRWLSFRHLPAPPSRD